MVSEGFYRHYKGHVYFVFGVDTLKHEGNRRIVSYTSVRAINEEIRLARDETDFEAWVRVVDDKVVETRVAPPLTQMLEDVIVVAQLLGDGFQPRFGRILHEADSVLPKDASALLHARATLAVHADALRAQAVAAPTPELRAVFEMACAHVREAAALL